MQTMNLDDPSPRTAVIIEDDADVRDLLAAVLESAGFSTISAENGLDGVEAVLTHQPLITTLDVSMPGIDGFEAARRIRAESDTYIIMLTALGEEADIVLGLTAGADEYLNKPFRPRELRARIDALLRRPRTPRPAAPDVRAAPEPPSTSQETVEQDAVAPDWITHRDLRLSTDSRIALMGGSELELTRSEFDLLCALIRSGRRVRSKAELTLELRGDTYVTNDFVSEADKRTVEAHITNLRRKLGESAASPNYIETIRGVGYRLTADD